MDASVPPLQCLSVKLCGNLGGKKAAAFIPDNWMNPLLIGFDGGVSGCML